jgi:predicted RNA-binding Zn ribbon-like protein
MPKLSRKFNVPDELANLYDFANSLDVRHFTHHGVAHRQGDELTEPRELGGWLAERDLLKAGASRISPAMFDAALKMFPLVAEARGDEGLVLRASRDDALAGLSVVVAELYNGSANGTLDRLKMCAAEECRRVFYDRSKPATRRWCMSTLCGNRMKTRTYRARHRGAV